MTKTRDALRAALPTVPALAAGALLRIWMFKEFPQDEGDSLIYGGLAKNLMLHGRYAITDGSGVLHATLIRLPGYPLFLAACFRLFGVDNYNAVAYVQIALELLGCLLLAGFARRIARPEIKNGAALATLWLAVLCPFTASYAAAPLTEAPTLFSIALALWAVGRFNEQPGWGSALWFTFAITFAAMLRPDGALVGVALAPAMVVGLRSEVAKEEKEIVSLANSSALKGRGFSRATRAPKMNVALATEGMPNAERKLPRGLKPIIFSSVLMARLKPRPFKAREYITADKAPRLLRMAVVCVLLALIPFAVWTARNWRVFHVFRAAGAALCHRP